METSHANQVELRNLQMEDYDQLARSFKRIYADSDVFWTHAQIKKLITIFPRRKQKDGRDFSYRSGHSKVIDSEYLQKNIHLSIKNHKAIRISIVTTMYES